MYQTKQIHYKAIFKQDHDQHKIEYMPNKFLFTDGYDPTTNTIYEYLGDYWHGNIGKYKKDFFNKKFFISLFLKN